MSPSTDLASGSKDFVALFGERAALRDEAPGRVNLIGEHTDYQGGFVLPVAIPQKTVVELRPRGDELVRAWSENTGGDVKSYRLGEERATGDWLDYVQGVTWAARAAGHALGGFDARISSRVPLGSGLSSSAALEVALLRALRGGFGLTLDDRALALVAHRAETEFVGAPVGVMDQMASSLCDTTSALFLDTQSLKTERIPIPPVLRLIVIDSGVEHRHATGGYRTRRAEAEAAAQALGVPSLRALNEEHLDRIEALPEPLRRRARHILTENGRVLKAVTALRTGDHGRLGRLLVQSHTSLRDDYEVTVPELDLLVEVARRSSAVVGARMTGGGFGGSVVIVAMADGDPGLAMRIAHAYGQRAARPATVLVG